MKILILFSLLSTFLMACPAPTERIVELEEAVRIVPITPSYTQGLVFYNGLLFESSGIYGKSRFSRVNPSTGNKRILNYLPKHIFAEGLAVLDEKLFQFSWKENLVFIYDAIKAQTASYLRATKVPYLGEAWGVTAFNNKLLLSDGTTKLHFLNPINLEIEDSFEVKEGAKPLDDLNELEIIEGSIWSNVWGDMNIFVINPDSGCVVKKLNFIKFYEFATKYASTNNPDYDPWEHVLNGIAYDSTNRQIYITGKNWRYIFVLDQ